jgi:hypothetical protein
VSKVGEVGSKKFVRAEVPAYFRPTSGNVRMGYCNENFCFRNKAETWPEVPLDLAGSSGRIFSGDFSCATGAEIVGWGN